MGRRYRYWLIAIVLCGLALAVYFEPTRCVRGWLWGEAFFDGRPTSYWRGVILEDLKFDPRQFADPVDVPPSRWQEIQHWIGYNPRTDSSIQLACHAEAAPVLRELSADDDQRIADFTRDLWKVHNSAQVWATDPIGVLITQREWQIIICKHNTEHKGLENFFAGKPVLP